VLQRTAGTSFVSTNHRGATPLNTALAVMIKALWPAAGILVVSLVAAAISAASGLRIWWVVALVAVAVLINGFVATLEDDLPGGFNNPDGSDTPGYALAARWALRIIGAIVLLLCVAALALFHWG